VWHDSFICVISLYIYMNEASHTCTWLMSHIWMSHVTITNESCVTHMHTYEHWFVCVTRLTYTCVGHARRVTQLHVNSQ